MKNLEFVELNAQELEEVNGGGIFDWVGDVGAWIGKKATQLWKWIKKHGKRDGDPGLIF